MSDNKVNEAQAGMSELGVETGGEPVQDPHHAEPMPPVTAPNSCFQSNVPMPPKLEMKGISHFAAKCPAKKSGARRVNIVNNADSEDESSSEEELLTIEPEETENVNTVDSRVPAKILVSLVLGEKLTQFQVDSGATCNVIAKSDLPSETEIRSEPVKLKMYNGSNIAALEKATIKLENPKNDKKYKGERARDLFLHSKLSLKKLSQIWNLTDVSNDNLLNVEEFVLAMHVILEALQGRKIPNDLSSYLPTRIPVSLDLPSMTDREKEAYTKVFQMYDSHNRGFIKGKDAMDLLRVSELSPEQLSVVWNLSDINRDGSLDMEEWVCACHLVRLQKQGYSLDGPINMFDYMPDRISPTSLQASKRRVDEYEKKKQRLMCLKEKRKKEAATENRRLEILREKVTIQQKLVSTVSSPMTYAHSYYNVNRVFSSSLRLKKDHEKIRQETVKVILEEQKLQSDLVAIKRESDELRQRSITNHTKATKEPDPFHQLYEQRKELRKRSTLSEGEEPDVFLPFNFNPFDPEVSLKYRHSPDILSAKADLKIPESNNNNKNNSDEKCGIVLTDLCEFSENFIERWSSPKWRTINNTMESHSEVEPEDVMFKNIKGNADEDFWFRMTWSDLSLASNHDNSLGELNQKLIDLKNELQKLNEENNQIIFRNPEDYIAAKKAKEDELLPRSPYQRRSRPGSHIERTTNEAGLAAKEYRQKRRSLHQDRKKDSGGEFPGKSDYRHRSLVLETQSQYPSVPERPRRKRNSATEEPKSPTNPSKPTSLKKTKAPEPPGNTSPESNTEKHSPEGQTFLKQSNLRHETVPADETLPSLELEVITRLSSQTESHIEDQGVSSLEYEPEKHLPQDIAVPHNKEKTIHLKNKAHAPDIPQTSDLQDTEKGSKQEISYQIISSKDSTLSKENLPEVKQDTTTAEPTTPTRPPRRKRKNSPKDDQSNVVINYELNNIKAQDKSLELSKEEKGSISESLTSEIDLAAEKVVIERNSVGEPCLHGNVKEVDDSVIYEQKTNFQEGQKSQPQPQSQPEEVSVGEVEFNGIKENLTNTATVSHTDCEQVNTEPIHEIELQSKIEFEHTVKKSIEVENTDSDLESGTPPPLPISAPPPSLSLNEQVVEEEITEISKREHTPYFTMSAVQHVDEDEDNDREIKDPVEQRDDDFTKLLQPKDASVHSGDILSVNGIDAAAESEEFNSDESDVEDGIPFEAEFIPGQTTTRELPSFERDDEVDDKGIELVSYSRTTTTMQSPGEQSQDSAFEDLMSSMTSIEGDAAFTLTSSLEDNQFNDSLLSEGKISKEKNEKVMLSQEPENSKFNDVKAVFVETQVKPRKSQYVHQKDFSIGSPPRDTKDIVKKARDFAEIVQAPPKFHIKREKDIADDMSSEKMEEMELKRRAVINESTVKRRGIEMVQSPRNDIKEGYDEDVVPDATFETSDGIALYSKNVVQEKETTESVDRESIADLSITRSHWEQFMKKPTNSQSDFPVKPSKTTVRHWEVQTKYKPVNVEPPVNAKTEQSLKSEPISQNKFGESTTVTDDMDPYSNESAIEREIRLAMERENMLKREQSERMELQARQKGTSVSEPPVTPDHDFKPTYHEMTEADRGSEMSQREAVIQQEIEDLQLREQSLQRRKESDDVTNGIDPDESIIEREIRLQKAREMEISNRYKTETQKPVSESFPSEQSDSSETESAHTNESITIVVHEEKPDIDMQAAHKGESIIARELRELKEKEDELNRQRKLAQGSIPTSHSQESVQMRENQKTEPRPVSWSSNIKVSFSPQPVKETIKTPNKNERASVRPYEEPKTPEQHTVPPVRQETPIEREIRLAAERENELRIQKGLPIKDTTFVRNNPESDLSSTPKSSQHETVLSHSMRQSGDYDSGMMRQFASSRLQKELRAQKQRENALRNEGIIVTTSEEHIGPLKYTEVIGENRDERTVKRNFTTRKMSSEPQISEQKPKENGEVQTQNSEETKFQKQKFHSVGASFTFKESRQKAESKIEQELREMREREEELRKQRGISPVSPRSPKEANNNVVDRKAQWEKSY
ncbi:hypothetical protein ScPMuIL_001083 [Solemya velum]